MNRFYIEKLVVSGGGHKASVIDFRLGLNFVLGPSNTGKSLVMDCMDYVFGLTPRKNRPSKIVDNSYGYERIALHLVTGRGTVKSVILKSRSVVQMLPLTMVLIV